MHSKVSTRSSWQERALGRDLAISSKQAIEICNYLRHRKVAQAKMLLEQVMEQKQALPFKRFTDGLGHKPGKMASGRYPMKASKAFIGLLESVEANAQTKGLNTNELEIIHLCAHRAHSPVHYGRNQGREFKRTHVEIVVQETAGKGKKNEQKKEVKKEAKAEPKPVEKKEAKAEAKAETKEAKAEPKPVEKKEAKAEPKPAEKKAEPAKNPEPSQEKKEEVSGETALEK
jgi:large subunit ribosomal protein L22